MMRACVALLAAAVASALALIGGARAAPLALPMALAPVNVPSSALAASDVEGRILFVHDDGEHGPRRVMQVPARGGVSTAYPGALVGSFVAAVDGSRSRVALIAVDQGEHGRRERLRVLAGVGSVTEGPLGLRARSPSFLPDGDVVYEGAFERFVDIHLLRSDGRHRRLTAERSGCFEPSAHPRGGSIAFVSSRDGDPEIYRAPITEGTGPVGFASWRRLTWSAGTDGSPTWSADGRHIAFISDRAGVPAVHVMTEMGGRPRMLAAPGDGVVEQRDLRWSPRGDSVAFIERMRERARLRVVRLSDGRDVVSRNGPGTDQTPAWSPDGEHVVFASNSAGDTELYRVAVATGEPTRLTTMTGADWLPLWLR